MTRLIFALAFHIWTYRPDSLALAMGTHCFQLLPNVSTAIDIKSMDMKYFNMKRVVLASYYIIAPLLLGQTTILFFQHQLPSFLSRPSRNFPKLWAFDLQDAHFKISGILHLPRCELWCLWYKCYNIRIRKSCRWTASSRSPNRSLFFWRIKMLLVSLLSRCLNPQF